MSQITVILFKYLSLIIGLTVLLRIKVKPLWLWTLTAGALIILLIHLYVMFPFQSFGFDFAIFWKSGCDVWAGLAPYAADRFADHPFLHPPTALPLFALFAIFPFRMSLTLWTAASVLASLALVALAQYALKVQGRIDDRTV